MEIPLSMAVLMLMIVRYVGGGGNMVTLYIAQVQFKVTSPNHFRCLFFLAVDTKENSRMAKILNADFPDLSPTTTLYDCGVSNRSCACYLQFQSRLGFLANDPVTLCNVYTFSYFWCESLTAALEDEFNFHFDENILVTFSNFVKINSINHKSVFQPQSVNIL